MFEQTYHNIEFLFCNDCTLDRSVDILFRVIVDYPQLKDRIRILHHETNRGLPATRNTLVDNCNGDFLVWVDSDDWVEPNMVELLVKKQLETNADIVTARAWKHSNNEVTEFFNSGIDMNREESIAAMISNRLRYNIWCRLIRLSLYKNNNIRCSEDPRVLEDVDTVPKLFFFANTVDGVDSFLYHYTADNEESLFNQYIREKKFKNDRLTVIQRLGLFLSNKESPFCEIGKRFLVRDLYRLSKFAYSLNDAAFYKEVMQKLATTDSNYWYLIGWDRTLVRWIEENYYFTRLTNPIRVYHGMLVHFFHR